MITGIVVALAEELSTLTRKRYEKGRIIYLNATVWVVYSGAGGENARRAAEILIEAGADRLVSWGCAAALDEDLQPGHWVLAENCIDSGQALLELDNKAWRDDSLSHFEKRIPIRVGRIVESKQIVETSAEKTKLRTLTGAIALDMESTAIAKVANRNGVPFITVRAIADTADMELPKAVAYAVNEQGEVELRKLLFFLLLRPGEIVGLIKLGFAFGAAKKTLKQIAKEIDVITRFGKPEASES